MDEKIFIENKKGLKLAAVLHRPKEKDVFPAVILLHGFTGYKEEGHIESLAKDLALNGFVAIRFDCLGFGESEGTTEKDFRFSNYLNDIESVYQYVMNQDFVSKEKIGIWGHSMGGMLSIIFASYYSEIKAVVSVSAPTAMWGAPSIFAKISKWKETGWSEKVTGDGKEVRIPFAFLEDAKQYNVLDFVVKVHAPLLVVLGTADINVLPSDTKEIFVKANQPKKLLKVEGMDHDYKNVPAILEKVNKEIVSFYHQNFT